MSKYIEILAEIKDLERQAVKIRKEELSSVIKSIRRQILEYGITANDLGFKQVPEKSRMMKVKRGSKGAAAVGSKGGSTKRVPPKFQDAHGNRWTGRGKKPTWIIQALESGVSLDSLRIT
jgi:DNA-binding protein H-NS